MTEEGGFLTAILANPADDVTRLVYADWLDEQQTDEASRKAEFLRLTAANRTETARKQRMTNERRMAELARHLSTDWLPVVSRLTIENCGQTRRANAPCPKKWEHLIPTESVEVRCCSECRQHVYYNGPLVAAGRVLTREQSGTATLGVRAIKGSG